MGENIGATALIAAVGGLVTAGFTALGALATAQIGPFAPRTTPKPKPTQIPSSSSQVDPCLVGVWRLVTPQHTSFTDNANGQTTPVTGGTGAMLTISSDGTEIWDYSSSAAYIGYSNGSTLTILYRGTVSATISAMNGHVHESHFDFEHIHGDGKWSTGDSFVVYPVPWTPDTNYSCTSTLLTKDNNEYVPA